MGWMMVPCLNRGSRETVRQVPGTSPSRGVESCPGGDEQSPWGPASMDESTGNQSPWRSTRRVSFKCPPRRGIPNKSFVGDDTIRAEVEPASGLAQEKKLSWSHGLHVIPRQGKQRGQWPLDEHQGQERMNCLTG